MKSVHVVFLLFPNTHLLDLSGAAQVFYEAGKLGSQPFRVTFASAETQITTEQGLSFAALTPIESISLKEGDFICIPGVDFNLLCAGAIDGAIEKTKQWLWQQRAAGVYIGSVCTGALILAKMGLLDHVSCTTHWKCLDYARKNFPHAQFKDHRLYLFDQGIFTSAGMTTGIDMALALIEKWCNPLLAAKVAQEMVINMRRADTREQSNIFLDFTNHFNADVYKAQEILSNRLDAGFTLSMLADRMNLSSRHLARLFKQHSGLTIQAYRDQLRLQHGEQLLLNTEMFVKEIAVACGFESARQFVRLWVKYKGMPPEEWRRAQGLKLIDFH